MKNLIDLYNSIIEESIFDNDFTDRATKGIQQGPGVCVVSRMMGIYGHSRPNMEGLGIKYDEKTKILKFHSRCCFPIYVDYENGTAVMSLGKSRMTQNNPTISVDEFKGYGVKIDGDIVVSFDAIDNGLKISDLNFVGKNREIRITYDKNTSFLQKGLDDMVIKSFFDVLPDPSNILVLSSILIPINFLKDPVVSRFAAVKTTLPYYGIHDASEIENCRAKVLMMENAVVWADPNNKRNKLLRLHNHNFKSYVDFFNEVRDTDYKDADYTILKKGDPDFKIYRDPRYAFRTFINNNPGVKLIVKLCYGKWEYIHMVNDKLTATYVPGAKPWKKI